MTYLYGKQEQLGAKVLPLLYFTVADWRGSPDSVWHKVERKFSGGQRLIVRSSAKAEDALTQSNAGMFESCLTDLQEGAFREAVERVLVSYGTALADDQFLVQPALEDVEMAGVAFTTDPHTGGSYYVINYDTSGSTSAITGGEAGKDILFYYLKGAGLPQDERLRRLCVALGQLERLLRTELLDVEFAFAAGELYILQSRPLVLKNCQVRGGIWDMVKRIEEKIRRENHPKPFLYGQKTIYSNMTDWNPAEMIGAHPRPLALSLYKELITDNIWAYQRDNYGYMNLRSFPLLLDFAGYPYIDVRVSFNSFIPADLDPAIAEKLVNYYLECLAETPSKHDKVEFDIVFSCYTFSLPERIKVLLDYGFTQAETEVIVVSLRNLTNRIINSKTGLWRKDREKIKRLEHRYGKLQSSHLDVVSRMYWLIEDCKRYGTLPFAGLARAAFIAVQILQSMVSEEIISQEEYDSFMADVETVGSLMKRDFSVLPAEDFLHRYGHLRPGAYDITSARYDEKPEMYFSWSREDGIWKEDVPDAEQFRLSLAQLKDIRAALAQHGLDDDVLGLFTFIRAAIENREFAKFIFTKSLSETLRLFGSFARDYGISLSDSSYADIGIIKALYGSAVDEEETLRHSIRHGKKSYQEGMCLILPPVISGAGDVECFFVPDSQPTYVTQKKVRAELQELAGDTADIQGKIVAIPAADPGFDWIFSHGIAGFITEYGGANSHMAIRAGELSIPAVIGCGKKLYEKVRLAKALEIDAAAKKVYVLR